MDQYSKETMQIIHYLIEKDAIETYDVHHISKLLKNASYVKPDELESLRLAFLCKGYQL